MNFRLVDSGWDKILDEALAADKSRVRVICPFIKERPAKRLLEYGRPKQLEVITRYDLDCFCEGVSDLAALRLLLQAGAKIRGIKNLHAKAYLIGQSRAIVTSANLTEQGLIRNHEFGFFADDEMIAANCHSYFDRLWKLAGSDLTLKKLEEWDRKVTAAWASGAGTKTTRKLGDEGVDVEFPAEPVIALKPALIAEQGFVKFFGEGHNRQAPTLPVVEELKAAGCHWGCPYPTSKIPRQVRDGAVMFMGRLVDHPKDTLIFGRAIGLQYVGGRDDATKADIARRPWKAKWSRYIRVHNGEFVNGTLADGVSLNTLMAELGSDSFAPTQRHAAANQGNTDPQAALMQKAAMELTSEAIAWLNERLDQSFEVNGRISKAELAKLDWPTMKL
jgi:PLD-like domain